MSRGEPRIVDAAPLCDSVENTKDNKLDIMDSFFALTESYHCRKTSASDHRSPTAPEHGHWLLTKKPAKNLDWK